MHGVPCGVGCLYGGCLYMGCLHGGCLYVGRLHGGCFYVACLYEWGVPICGVMGQDVGWYRQLHARSLRGRCTCTHICVGGAMPGGLVDTGGGFIVRWW